MSLPGLLGTTLETTPADAPYLHADPARVEKWKERLEALHGLKVGVVWQGNPNHPWDRWRSFPLARLAPLAAVEGVRLVGLQKGPGVEQLKALKGRFAVEEWGEGLDGEGGAFLDTAAVMQGLDLVVTADTAAAHLAGALGVNVWVALSAVADWRWMVGREDTPWYPTMRLFRQAALGDWEEAFGRMADELRRLVGRERRGVPARVEMSPGELLDRIGILEIKGQRMSDPRKRAQVREELAALRGAGDAALNGSEEAVRLAAALKAVNEALWEVEDELRRCEQDGDFGPRFVELARSVYRRNDERGKLKRRINEPSEIAVERAERVRRQWIEPLRRTVIGSIRRECLDHLIVFDEAHLRRILSRYFDYYHNSRTHRALDDNPLPACSRTARQGTGGRHPPGRRPAPPLHTRRVVTSPSVRCPCASPGTGGVREGGKKP